MIEEHVDEELNSPERWHVHLLMGIWNRVVQWDDNRKYAEEFGFLPDVFEEDWEENQV